ncbi:hypothetical protein ACIA8C_07430 [Nocardia sp. NPDC051321]|uniref:hypothetical protein n=1 Tax=Nocardia sp. NPDC051321 TaxID=3364323 RepID=UPI0037A81480
MTETAEAPLLTRLAAAGAGFRLAPPPGSLAALVGQAEPLAGWSSVRGYAELPGVLSCEVHLPSLDGDFAANSVQTAFVFDYLTDTEDILNTAADLANLGSADVAHEPLARISDRVRRTTYFGTYPHDYHQLCCWIDYYLIDSGTESGGYLLQHAKTATETQWPTVEADFSRGTARVETFIETAVSRDRSR